MLGWLSSSARRSVGRRSVVIALALALALPVSQPAAAQHTSVRRSPVFRSARKAAGTASEPIRTLQVTPQGDTTGSPWTGQQGVSETTARIMRRERAMGKQKPEEEETETEKTLPPRDLLPLNPLSPQESQWPPKKKGEQPSPVLTSPQTAGLSFTGATLGETAAFPPDTMGAVGPTQFVASVNNRIKVFDKTSGALGALNSSTNAFFQSVRDDAGTSDPRVRFDRLSGRWFIIIINTATPNRVLLAVSDNATITAGTVWTFFFFRQDLVSPIGESGCFADYPTLGIDANALYIGVNQFCPAFGGTTAFVVRKSSILGAGPIVASAFRNLTGTPGGAGLYTPQGVDNYDPAATEGYFVGVDNATFGTLVVRRISDPGGTPVMSPNAFITVPSTSFPLTVPHMGNTNGTVGKLDGLDDRLFAAHIRNGRLWTAQNIAVDNTGTTAGVRTRNAARWYELSGLNTATPTLVQAGTLFAATPTNTEDDRHYWIPSIMVSGQGHAAMGASAAGTNEFINASTVGRLASDPLGALEAPVLLTSSATAYNPPGNDGSTRGRRRWGDYSYTSLDPCDDMTMWTIQEFCDSLNSYGVRIVKLIAPPPVTPLSANPALIPQGQSSINVTVSGFTTGGKGFYDPGPGFACRLAASIGGGIAVNSVSYNSPGSITLNLSTVAALIGSKSIAITNPDGQSSSGGQITVGASGSCSFTLSSAAQNFTAPGGTGGFNVTTAAGCPWTATSNDSWITITSGSGGTGNGSVSFSVSNNPGAGQRTGTMTVGGVNFLVSQDGTGVCGFSIAPPNQNFVVGGGTGSVSVTADAGCGWMAVSNSTFITITSGSSGSGNGTVNYSVSANPTISPRTGTMTIAGLPFTVTQDPIPCTFSLSPTTQSFSPTGGGGVVSVTTLAGCMWTASSNDGWISILSGATGTGTGTVGYNVAANPGSASRTGTMTIAGSTFTVLQSGGGTDTIGLFRPSGNFFFLRNNNSLGPPDITVGFGAPGDLPIVGDWDGNGTVTIGLYRPSTSTFFLRNSNSLGPPDITFSYGDGPGGDIPIAGDWDGNGTWTVGVYRPSTSTFFIRNSNTFGVPDITITFGAPGDMPLAGDWDGNGTMTIGLFRPSGNFFFLRNSNTFGPPDVILPFGAPGDLPIVGDWDGDGTTTIGLFRPAGNFFFLRNANTLAPPDIQFTFGAPGDKPIVGNWDGL